MSKYRTIVDHLNVYFQGELIEVLEMGSTIEVEKIVEAKDVYNRLFKMAILKDGNELIASNGVINTIVPVKTVKKKGDK